MGTLKKGEKLRYTSYSMNEDGVHESEWKTKGVVNITTIYGKLNTGMLPNKVFDIHIPEGVELISMDHFYGDHFDEFPSTLQVLYIGNAPNLKKVHLSKGLRCLIIDRRVEIINLEEVLKNEDGPNITLV